MHDLDIIKEILQRHEDKTGLYWSIIALLLVNVITSVATFMQNWHSQKAQEKQYRQKIREDRRINILEKIYLQLDELTYYDGKDKNDELISKIGEIERYIAQNGIYISKEIQNCLNDTLDYFRSVSTNPKKKSYEIESNHITQFVTLFNK